LYVQYSKKLGNKTLQIGFGMNERTSIFVTSTLNPFSLSGIKIWAIIAVKYAIPDILNRFTYDVKAIKGAPKEALRSKERTSFDQLLNKVVKYQMLNTALNFISTTIDDIINDALTTPIAERLRKEVFEEEEGKISFFFHDVVLHNKEKEARLLQECIFTHTKTVINHILDLTVGLPINALKLFFISKTVLSASQPLAPYLVFPFNAPYKVLAVLSFISLGKVAASYVVEKLAISIKESSRENENRFKILIDYASKNAVSIVFNVANIRMLSSMHKAYNSGASNILHILSNISKKVNPIFKVFEEDFLPRFIGKAIFKDASLSYKESFYPVYKAFADMRKVITSIAKIMQQYTNL
jgi:hypothetical protein